MNEIETLKISSASTHYCEQTNQDVIVPTFQENGIFVLDVVYFYSVNFRQSKQKFSTKLSEFE